MRKLCLLICGLALLGLVRSDVSHLRSSSSSGINALAGGSQLSEYSIRPSSQVAYYHYPVPSQPLKQPTPHHLTRSQTGAYHHHQQQQQQQLQQQYQQQRHYHHSTHAQRTTYQQQQQQQQSPLLKQFTAPALEQAAFTQALSNQGYVFGSGVASAPLTAAASSASAAQTTTAAHATGRASTASAATSNSVADANSLNVKLPVPFGITPLNIAQLPLQVGAPYSSVRGLTSYGTLHPQRRRR